MSQNYSIHSIKVAQTTNMKTIVFTGGGTAGHIMPNVALFPEAKKHFDKIAYIGSSGMEKQIIGSEKDVDFYEIDAVKLVRSLTLKNLAIPFKLHKSISQAKKVLKKLQPNVVFSKGGYVSLPTVIAAKKLKIPVISHESDMTMGLANRIIYRYSDKMLTTFECTAKGKSKCVFVGSPIREKVLKGNKNNLNLHFGNKPNILFFGGSLGAKKINDAVENALPELTKKYNIIHLTGKGKKINLKTIYPNYYQQEYANNIEDFFNLADLVVTRGGANALFELLAIQKPMLIIPLPKAESRGDQLDNAKYFSEKSYAKVLYQENLTTKTLLNALDELEKDKEKIKKAMEKAPQKNSNQKIMEIIAKTAK